MRMEKDRFLQCRNEIVKVLEKEKADAWERVKVLASAMNEILAPDGHQAVITLRPLLVYREVENKI